MLRQLFALRSFAVLCVKTESGIVAARIDEVVKTKDVLRPEFSLAMPLSVGLPRKGQRLPR